jgi:hypothetical protein
MKSKIYLIGSIGLFISILSFSPESKGSNELGVKVVGAGSAISLSMTLVHLQDYLTLGRFAPFVHGYDAKSLEQARRDLVLSAASHGVGSLWGFYAFIPAQFGGQQVTPKLAFIYPAFATFLSLHAYNELHKLSDEVKNMLLIRHLLENAWKVQAVDFIGYAAFQSLAFIAYLRTSSL